ncbi:DUF433 domain-containing protein [Kitasatospora sp. NPDC092039]|uniref:DUF433 domain-containing protein n=1 Tax=Kitasatospora sp. NPDC092039 TaxID=3364086 RepID=UPI00381467DD
MKYLDSSPNIASGDFVLKGTRIRITQFIDFMKNGVSIAQLHEWYPWVSKKQISGAVDEANEIINNAAHA